MTRLIPLLHLIRAAFWAVVALTYVHAAPTRADPPAYVFVDYMNGQVDQLDASAGASVDTPFVLASVGKTMTAVAALRLVADGTLALDAPIAPLLPDGTVTGLGGLDGVTLRHLLTMTAGLPDYLSDAYSAAAVASTGAMGAEDALRYAYGLPPLFAPGTGFDYSNTNYLLVQLAMTQVTGQPYSQLMAQHVFGPSRMAGAFVFGSRPLPAALPNGHENGAHVRDYYMNQGFGDGGVIASAQDLYRFYTALFVDRALLRSDLLEQMMTDASGEGYGMGLDLAPGEVGHSGGDLGFSSDVRLDLDTGDIFIELIARGD
ncbi:MAG: serine hydrolase domain-containing protein [Pseudomonadota bacterium]